MENASILPKLVKSGYHCLKETVKEEKKLFKEDISQGKYSAHHHTYRGVLKKEVFNKTTRKHNKVLNGVYQDKTAITYPLIFYMLWFGCVTGDSLK